MARQFALAGLLRVRQTEHDQALARTGAAEVALRSHRDHVHTARSALADGPAEVTSAAALRAVAAARSSTSSMLTELLAADGQHAQELDEARTELVRARVAVQGLERLQERHEAAVVADELAAEQVALDEIASQAWRRNAAVRS
ncbi:flagellar FliJ family protein [Georgenia sp. AZ-5]|uniref:flagellar FliJ family protein n=1 Tax=Georgenia sp. AZ-5 TaxID=3367526 RepID=UPI0037550385